VPPLMLKTATNPEGLPLDVFDGLRKATADNQAQLFLDVPTAPFHRFNREGAKVYPGVIRTGGTTAQWVAPRHNTMASRRS
jgi:non-heme chloroperoxidase